MTKSNNQVRAAKPKNFFQKPLKADLKSLFKSLSSGICHSATGKWEEVGSDAVEALSSIGLTTEPEELVFLLIRRSLTKALFDLLGENVSQILANVKIDANIIVEKMEFSVSTGEVHIDSKFFNRPADLPLIAEVQSFLAKWLEGLEVQPSATKAITERLPSYFVYSLNYEWRKNAKSYRPLTDIFDTPFTKAGDREWAWAAYSATLQRRVQEGIFEEPFSLKQIYVPLNAFYLEEDKYREQSEEMEIQGKNRRRVVVSLQEEMEKWLQNPKVQDAIRIISGGPGSGKSSFARIFAAQISQYNKQKVLFVPLHLFDPTLELVDAVGRFVKDEGILLQNPLDPDSPEPNLLIIFDGLDELASQGKAAEETARAFVREVERTVERRNQHKINLRVLISGREVIVQNNESEFRHPGQILTLLPYFIPEIVQPERQHEEMYLDHNNLLKNDLRQQWWVNYGALSGKGYSGLPKELSRDDLSEVTGQPLLNYLVALSFTREKIDFEKNINLNSIYADLVTAVHERGYEKHRPYAPIRHMTANDFSRVLEEISLAAWHGDGRSTTVGEIEFHCRTSGLGRLLDVFQEGAKAGVTRLLAAFFFRQYGKRLNGDPTFVFTHKSFGEYLTARRIVRSVERMARELKRHIQSPDEGWDERDALKHWVQICGPSAVTEYLHVFLLNEVKGREIADICHWRDNLSQLFKYSLLHGMPMEQLQIVPFKEALFQSRNAEEALLIALNICASRTEKIVAIDLFDPTVFWAWFRRVQGQRTGPEASLAGKSLSWLDLSGSVLHLSDLYGANLENTIMSGAMGNLVSFGMSNLKISNFENAHIPNGYFEMANLNGANFKNANLRWANFERAKLLNANFENAKLVGANFLKAKINDTNFEGANLEGANFKGIKFNGANFKTANLAGANFEGANFEGASFEGANLKGAKLARTCLEGANFKDAILPKYFQDRLSRLLNEKPAERNPGT